MTRNAIVTGAARGIGAVVDSPAGLADVVFVPGP